ncbi:MAG: GNAT family N-acetyltransferase [Desulfobacterales bacterium]|nr:GNAT family N-acetyltransferase [Desulfobacterales bacterium]
MGRNKIIIRDAIACDIDSLTILLQQLFSIEKDFVFNLEKQKQGLLILLDGCGKHRTIKVAQYNNTIVGMLSVQTRISTAMGNITAVLEDLVVDSNYRNMGIGKMLLEACYSWALKRGITHLQLLADKENQHALTFYERQSWNKTNLICLLRTL